MIDYLNPNPDADCDTECFPNYWSIGFADDDGNVEVYELFEEHPLDRKAIARAFRKYRVFTFNGINYDIPMILFAMKGATNAELKKLNDELIVGGLRHWEAFDKYDLSLPDFIDHVDLFNVAPAAAQKFSLKKYAGTLHSESIQELPFPPDTWLTRAQIQKLRSYHGNDLVVNQELRHEMRPQVQLRSEISAKYNFDFRSKSDAQCGEAVVKLLVEKRMGKRIYKPDIRPGTFNYVAPAYVQFETAYMQQVLSELLRSPFRVRHDGYVEPPPMFGKKKGRKSGEDDLVNDGETYEGGSAILIGDGVYKMGIGGLHSQESCKSHYESDDEELIDVDVVSYYPEMMINSGQEPENMRGYFRAIYRDDLVRERKAAKKKSNAAYKAGDKKMGDFWKSVSESLKIFINGLFGKTGSPYSIVYAPKMMIQTTVTGQVSILMIIVHLVLHGFTVVSANTDGFVTKVPKSRRLEFDARIFDWEVTTGLETEKTFYRSLHSRDVNSYLALKKKQRSDGSFTGEIEVKRKGAYAPSGRGVPAAQGLKKTPDAEVCVDAVIAYLLEGTPVESTVRNCQDIRKFVRVRTVKGGGKKNGEYIGKVVRYYYADDNPGPITYVTSGNRVPSSDGAEPYMTMPKELPDNIDYEWYEREAWNILDDIGLDVPDPSLVGRTGMILGRREDQKTLHTINAATGIALCGAKRASRRDSWVESKTIADGFRACAKCRKAGDL